MENSIEQLFNELLQALYDEKQGRTERDRYVAIAITDVEKAKAV